MRLSPIAAFLVVLGAAVPAAAHVSVSADDPAPGALTTITFKVPTESDSASTVSLKLQFPTDTPIPSVEVQPKPGWTVQSTTVKLATPVKVEDDEISETISEVTWTAPAGQGIKPGEFDTFVVNAGPLPSAPSVTFKAIQGYSDGTSVAWTEVTAPGSTAEPEHPAPVLTLATAKADAPAAAVKKTSTAVPTTLSIMALALGAAALALSLRGRRT